MFVIIGTKRDIDKTFTSCRKGWHKGLIGTAIAIGAGLAAAGGIVAAGAAVGAAVTGAAIAVGIGTTALVLASSAERKKAEGKALSAAEEQEVRAREEARRREGVVLDATALTESEEARERRTFELEERRQPVLEERAGLSGEELLQRVGPTTRRLVEDIAAEQGLTGEELFRREGAIPQALQEQILAEVQDPSRFFESTLEGELELARQMVNAEANRRGVFGGVPEGGIRFEQLGRAGVELSIKSARERMAQRQQALANASQLSTQFLDLRERAFGRAAAVGEAGLAEQQQARGELADFLSNMQQLSAQARGRAGAGALASQQLGAGITGAAAERRFTGEQEVFGFQAGRAAAGEQAGLGFAGLLSSELITGGVKEPTAAPGADLAPRFDLDQAARLRREPIEELGFRSGALTFRR